MAAVRQDVMEMPALDALLLLGQMKVLGREFLSLSDLAALGELVREITAVSGFDLVESGKGFSVECDGEAIGGSFGF